MTDSGLSNSHAEPQETASLLSVSADPPALDVSRNGIMRCVAFYTWPLSVGVMFLALLCVVARGSIWFPFTAEQCSTVWTGHIPCTLSAVYSLSVLTAFLSSACLLSSLPALPMERGLPREPGLVWAAWIWSLRL